MSTIEATYSSVPMNHIIVVDNIIKTPKRSTKEISRWLRTTVGLRGISKTDLEYASLDRNARLSLVNRIVTSPEWASLNIHDDESLYKYVSRIM